jgi:CRP-like cAMP-binding protein
LPEDLRVITGNRILDALPAAESERLRPHLEPVSFALRQVLERPGQRVDYVYFPAKGALSVIILLQDGSAIEVGTVGHEGMLGLAALLGDGISLHEVIIQAAGTGFRIGARLARQEMERSTAFRALVLKLSQFVLAEISQNAACNGHHDLRSRCARWLLTMADKTDEETFALSQEFLATMLGVQRTAVTGVAQKLREEGLIHYRRGRIEIVDRAGLESAACECYGMMRELHRRLLAD